MKLTDEQRNQYYEAQGIERSDLLIGRGELTPIAPRRARTRRAGKATPMTDEQRRGAAVLLAPLHARASARPETAGDRAEHRGTIRRLRHTRS